jgi:predicted component of type VI protein secretion system
MKRWTLGVLVLSLSFAQALAATLSGCSSDADDTYVVRLGFTAAPGTATNADTVSLPLANTKHWAWLFTD